MVLPFVPSSIWVILCINASLFAFDESKYSVSSNVLLVRSFSLFNKDLRIVSVPFFNLCIFIHSYCFEAVIHTNVLFILLILVDILLLLLLIIRSYLVSDSKINRMCFVAHDF